MKAEKKAAEKQLIFRDEISIANLKEGIKGTKPLMEDTLKKWNEIPELKELVTEDLHNLFNNPETFNKETKEDFYERKYGEAHRNIGILPAAGINLVALPDMSSVMENVKYYFEVHSLIDNKYVSIEYFKILNNTIVVDEDRVSDDIERCSFYIDTPKQFEFQGLINNLIIAIDNIEKAANETLYSSLFHDLTEHTYKVNGIKLDRFIELSRNSFKPNIQIFKELKQRGI